MAHAGESYVCPDRTGFLGEVALIRESVAALVVTYNRRELLARCLDAVLVQTRPVDRIIIVDNCSADGTQEYLGKKGYLSNSLVEYLRLTENMGAGGGFHAGMRVAYEHGHDWIWTLDDDGVPLPDNLSKLLECSPHILFRGSVVISSDDPSGDSLAYGLPGSSGFVHSLSELENCVGMDGIVPGHANPWNGVLFSGRVVRQIGVPKKELFCRFVETEYFLRAKKAGIPIGTVLSARVLHRSERQLEKVIRLGPVSFKLPYHDDPFVFYLLVRNSAYALLRHRGPLHKSFLKLGVYPLAFPGRAGLSSRALYEGVVGRFLPLEKIRAVVSKL